MHNTTDSSPSEIENLMCILFYNQVRCIQKKGFICACCYLTLNTNRERVEERWI